MEEKVWAYWFTPNEKCFKITDDSIEHGGFVLEHLHIFNISDDECKTILDHFGVSLEAAVIDVSGLASPLTDAIAKLAMVKGAVKVRIGYEDDVYVVYYGEKGKRLFQNIALDYYDEIFDGKKIIYVSDCKSHIDRTYRSSKELIGQTSFLFERILSSN